LQRSADGVSRLQAVLRPDLRGVPGETGGSRGLKCPGSSPRGSPRRCGRSRRASWAIRWPVGAGLPRARPPVRPRAGPSGLRRLENNGREANHLRCFESQTPAIARTSLQGPATPVEAVGLMCRIGGIPSQPPILGPQRSAPIGRVFVHPRSFPARTGHSGWSQRTRLSGSPCR
jgi:hypothetical protein